MSLRSTLAAIASALVLTTAASAQIPVFESDWNAWATYNPNFCDSHAGFNIDWDPAFGVWVLSFAVKPLAPATEVQVTPEACNGGLPADWEFTAQKLADGTVTVYARAPFDIETGLYYNLLQPYGKWHVDTDACDGNDGGFCIVPPPNGIIEVGGYGQYGQVIASTSDNGGVVLESPCAATQPCGGHGGGGELGKATNADTWGNVKSLYH